MQLGAVRAGACGADDSVLERAGALRIDQLATEGAEQRLRDRRQAQLPHAAEMSRCPSDQRVLREPAQKLGMVVVEREHEAQVLQALLTLRAENDTPVDELPRAGELDAVVDAQRRRQRAVTNVARRVVGVANAERERVRPSRPDDARGGQWV